MRLGNVRPVPVADKLRTVTDPLPPNAVPETSAGWNFADIWEAHAARFPDATAQIHGSNRTTWAEFDARANGVAAALLAAGVERQDKIAHYLYNCPQYLESMFAMFKAGLVPVNTNYRYTDNELVYLWTNADAVGVVFHGAFVEHIDRIRGQLPHIRIWLWVDDGSGPCPEWASDYEEAASSTAGRQMAPWGRSGDDLYLLYTGGTTGMPKGVMWRQDDIVMLLDAPSKRSLPAQASAKALEDRVAKPGIVAIPAAPLMHGTGAFAALNTLMLAGSIVTLEGRRFDAAALLDCIDANRVTSMSIVGDAFAKPILRALDAEPDRWDFSSMRVILSSGVIWSSETKQGLLRHNPRLMMIDSLGSSEAIGMAASMTDSSSAASAGQAARTAAFRLNANTRVIDDEGRDVVPGSGERGLVALKGRTPIGYYKDEEKSAKTFVTIGGDRYSIPGDFAEVEADGTLKLLGRGSQCINTGGEKVYPEEVEEALKGFPGVLDAVVVGVPDERFGEAVIALVEGPTVVSDAELIAHVRSTLAAYKSPKRIIRIESVDRAANGKVDYKRLRAVALEALAR